MKILILNPPSKYSSNVARDLFYGCWCKGKRIAGQAFPPLNLMYVATVLNQKNDVVMLDSQAEKLDFENTLKKIEKINPEAIIIPTSSMNVVEDSINLKKIKKNIDVITLAFGSHTTFEPEQSLSYGGIDYAVMREPEYIIRDFIDALEKKENYEKINGIAFKKNNKIKINKPYPFIEKLDELPFPDRKYTSQFVYFSPIVKKIPWTTALTSRGCPGSCTFCTSVPFYGNRLRFRSAKNVIDEMEYLIDKGYKEIFYRDETFTAHSKRLKNICRSILDKKIDISWICNARIGTLNKENIKLMKRAGCHMIKIGVESGSQKILDNIKKGITSDMTKKTFRWMNETGMESHAHVMLGCPEENWKTVHETIKLLKKIKPTTATFNAFTIFPGTPIYEEVKKKFPEIDATVHDTSKEHSIGFHNDLISDLTDKEVGKAVNLAYKKFYLRPSYILRTLTRLKSLDEFRRVVSAGFDILSFSRGKNE